MKTDQKAVSEILRQTGVVPVIKIENAEDAAPLCRALLSGGIGAAEVTFRTPAAPRAMEAIAREVPDIFLCAGTVLTVEQANLAVACGARAIVSPGTNPRVVEWCLKEGVPVYPGCATPTEVEAALSLGLTDLKLFPAEAVGGVKLLKALYGPYAGVRFMPTGGVSTQNLQEYLLLPNVLCCGGSWLCPADAVNRGDWETVRALAKSCRALVDRIRGSEAVDNA